MIILFLILNNINRAKFYVAEVLLALGHLHAKGVVYRGRIYF